MKKLFVTCATAQYHPGNDYNPGIQLNAVEFPFFLCNFKNKLALIYPLRSRMLFSTLR